jgi:hypothetical protein
VTIEPRESDGAAVADIVVRDARTIGFAGTLVLPGRSALTDRVPGRFVGLDLKNGLPFEWVGEIAMRGPRDEMPTFHSEWPTEV